MMVYFMHQIVSERLHDVKGYLPYQRHVLGRSGLRNVRVVVARRAALPGKVMVVGKAGETGERVCESCGVVLKKPVKGPWPRFCGDRCRKAKSRKGKVNGDS